ncbi:hypothetical protein HXX76_011908 [Chlamydomonas incerta]|uniref:Iron hydrogenase small subunit domain-containing protein n=1 Tax=Chlamydomonas incerta TaxID=51695 RepID=A0A835SLS2_CHLIN|nr:hypothetical protein HXX76_011908 [Chlamydomonas incerta]|eukprot:KAG2427921.1 hypothetical protein HXX76_011908 [Chlamydomonas incerta]
MRRGGGDKPQGSPGRKVVIAQVAPAVRVAISETFGLAPGATSPGQLAAALRQLGFDYVTHQMHRTAPSRITWWAQESHPHTDEPMPMFTSCCPGWIAMMEKSYPELIPARWSRTYLSDKLAVAPADLVMVSVMPWCVRGVRKQGEADREERGIALPELPEGEWDVPLGLGSGAAGLFGTTGGVYGGGAAHGLRDRDKEPLPRLNLSEVRGMDGIKEASVQLVPAEGSSVAAGGAASAAAAGQGAIQWDGGQGFSREDGKGGLTLRVAVANGLGNAKKLITKMQSGEAKFDFVEIMSASPAPPTSSHENPAVGQIYAEFLGEPLSHRAHELLHTHYVAGGVEEKDEKK